MHGQKIKNKKTMAVQEYNNLIDAVPDCTSKQ